MSINPNHKKNNGRSTFISLFAQHSGEDKWQKLLKDSADILYNLHWPGQGIFTLEKFILVHRNLYAMMTQFSDHVDDQLSNKYTRMNFLLDAIKCKDPGLNAAISIVKVDKGPTRNMNKSED